MATQSPLGKKKYFVSINVILTSLFFRFVIIVLDTVADVNPHTDSDAVSFALRAEWFAQQLSTGGLGNWIMNISGSTNDKWGIILSPFWIAPGPSEVYAASALAILTSVGIYNVYIIGRYFDSHITGLLAAFPLIISPNHIAIHGSVLRDGMLFFALTTAARYLTIGAFSKRKRIIIPIISIALSYYLRSYILVPIILAIASGYLFYLRAKRISAHQNLYIITLLSIPAVLYIKDRIKTTLLDTASTRSYGARGRTAYLGDIVPESLYEVISFSWIGFFYFMFAPFPWQISSIIDIFASIESMLSLLLVPFAVLGVRQLYNRDKSVTIGLVMYIIIGATAFGLGSANYGTAIRHRQMFLWVIFIFAAIGLVARFDLRLS